MEKIVFIDECSSIMHYQYIFHQYVINVFSSDKKYHDIREKMSKNKLLLKSKVRKK